MRPFVRPLIVNFAALGLAALFSYVAIALTESPRTSDPASAGRNGLAQPHEPTRTPEQKQADREHRLYGSDHDSNWRAYQFLDYGDHCLIAGFSTSFMTEFKSAFGSRIGVDELPAPSRENILEVVLGQLHATLRQDGQDPDKLVRPIAEFLALVMTRDADSRSYSWRCTFKAEKSPAGAWSVYEVRDFKENEQIRQNRTGQAPDFKAFETLLRDLPKPYALYLASLVEPREKAISRMDELLALPASEKKALEAVALYRRARLTMSLEDWPKLDDAQAKLRLAKIRADLAEVPTKTKGGSLDPCRIGENTEYWLAYARSMVLPADRLVRMGEADFTGSLATYLRMPERGEANAVNSSYRLARQAASQSDLSGCAKDPDLRRLITIYLCSNATNGYGDYLSRDDVARESRIWLDALTATKTSPDFDPVSIAILQHRVGRWQDCLETLKSTPPGHPIRLLLRSRCALRLGADLTQCAQLLQPETSERHVIAPGKRSLELPPDDGDFVMRIELKDLGLLRRRAEGELGVVRLCLGDLKEAFRLFTISDHSNDADYVGECLLDIEELRSVVDQMKRQPRTIDQDVTPWSRPAMNSHSLLAARLFRADRWDEAMEYMEPPLRTKAATYVLLRRLAERPDITDRAKADALWRAALLIGDIGEQVLRAPLGLCWTPDYYFRKPDTNWYVNYGFIPNLRLNQELEREHAPRHLLIAPGEDETRRVKTWIDGHVTHPIRSERDARYATFDLALQAAKLLPDNDPAGAEILQYAGNLLKYREAKAATPAYRLLVTRFKATPYGAEALKLHWFSKDRPKPSPDIISQ